MKHFAPVSMALLGLRGAPHAQAASTYLNISNITVEVGAGTSPVSFNNTFGGSSTIDNVPDAPSADAEEFHDQTTHIWFTANLVGGGLELKFSFGIESDLNTLHFWNYTSDAPPPRRPSDTAAGATWSVVARLGWRWRYRQIQPTTALANWPTSGLQW